MISKNVLTHEFVEYIPDDLKDRTIYVSVAFATAVHKCCCGCGNQVVTPLSPAGWKLTFDGETVSLEPSIGNWSFACQSHYWIRQNKVVWARRWSPQEIEANRVRDRLLTERVFNVDGTLTGDEAAISRESGKRKSRRKQWWKLGK
jgi:hypothetical protein